MPRGDGTGPAGAGPMTGRAAGFCVGYQAPGYANPVGGRGMGMGWGRGGGWGRGAGRGWGRRNQYYATGLPGFAQAGYGGPAWGGYPGYGGPVPMASPEQELADLKQQAEYSRNALDEIGKRIEEVEKAKQEK